MPARGRQHQTTKFGFQTRFGHSGDGLAGGEPTTIGVGVRLGVDGGRAGVTGGLAAGVAVAAGAVASAGAI